uniref:uncharacterized protein LOC100181286 isoform X2 n=1 Tax=Ciona intestinalis TaxID=7719 RepID=UPI00006A4225|nr:uncharacterized protein LOC100181286 isoform X2 [Ciona intestinalis]|eukprot:XP_002132015.1 uncharacterized protein LOC100181286 isoform X2 [Ciona intestinalis]
MEIEPKEITKKDFYSLIQKAQNELGIRDEDVVQLPIVRQIKHEGKNFKARNAALLYAGIVFFIVVGLPSSLYLTIIKETSFGNATVQAYMDYYEATGDRELRCLSFMPYPVLYFTRPPINCSECMNVKDIKYASNLSQEEFLDLYAFSMQPILVKDGQRNWTAKNAFSYDYFKGIYSPGSKALKKTDKDCQFFPYQTANVNNMADFVNMSAERAAGKTEPYYCGWSNCDGKAANELRQHYKRPYFLSPELDHSKIDWVFMGLKGFGAELHIDNVGTTSWQAQIKGTKKWVLEAPPECYGTCIPRMEVIVEPGDIIVLDTNKWFHATEILGNETSIVIGSEYY